MEVALGIAGIVRQCGPDIFNLQQAHTEVLRQQQIQTSADFNGGRSSAGNDPFGLRKKAIEGMYTTEQSLGEDPKTWLTFSAGMPCINLECIARAGNEFDLVYIYTWRDVRGMTSIEAGGQPKTSPKCHGHVHSALLLTPYSFPELSGAMNVE